MLTSDTSYTTLHDRDATLQTTCSMQHRLNVLSTTAIRLLQKLGEQDKQQIKDYTRSNSKPDTGE